MTNCKFLILLILGYVRILFRAKGVRLQFNNVVVGFQLHPAKCHTPGKKR